MAAITFYPAALAVLLRSAGGPVGRDLAKRATRVQNQAKVNASGRPGPNVQSGRLRSSITWAFGFDGGGIYADVGTNVFYGPFVEGGTSRMPAYPFLLPALSAA